MGTKAEAEDERLLLPGAQWPHLEGDGTALTPTHASIKGAVDPKDPEAGGSRGPWAPPHPARGVRYLCRQPALWPRCTRASKRLLTENNSLTLKKSECFRGSLRILSLTSGMGGEDAVSVAPQLPTLEGSNMGAGRGSEAQEMQVMGPRGRSRRRRREPGSDRRSAGRNPSPVFTQKGGAQLVSEVLLVPPSHQRKAPHQESREDSAVQRAPPKEPSPEPRVNVTPGARWP